MSKKPSKPVAEPHEEQPQTGGAYIRLPDGSLVREEPETVAEPVDQGNADPAAESAAPQEQEA